MHANYHLAALICFELLWRMQLALSAFAGSRQSLPPLEQSLSNAVRMNKHVKSLRHVASPVRVWLPSPYA